MQVVIRFKDSIEFQRLCQDYLGEPAEFVKDFVLATAPGQQDRVCIYRIPDESVLSTWIRICHPAWIDYVWTDQNRSTQHLDPDETFNKLVMEDLNERRANTTP
jgi:hypothetical protein